MDQNRSNVESSGSASPDGVDTTLSHDKTTVEIPEIEEHAASEVRDSGSTLLRSPLDDNINTTSSSGYNTASGSRRGSNNTQPQPPAIQLPPMNTLPSHPLALYQGTAGQQSSVTFSYAPTHVYGAPVLPTYASVGYGPQQPQQPQQVGQVPQAYSQVPMATSPLTFGTRTLPYPFPVTMAGGYHYAQSSSDASYQQPISIPSVIPSYHQKFHNDIIPIQSMPIGTSLEPNLSTVENMGHEEIARPTSTQSAGAPMKPLSRINTARPNSSIGVAIERMPIGDLHLSAITPGTATDINMQLGTPTAGTSTPPDLMLESAAPSTAMVSSSRRDSRSRRATISSVTPNDESATASSLSIASTISGMSTSGQR